MKRLSQLSAVFVLFFAISFNTWSNDSVNIDAEFTGTSNLVVNRLLSVEFSMPTPFNPSTGAPMVNNPNKVLVMRKAADDASYEINRLFESGETIDEISIAFRLNDTSNDEPYYIVKISSVVVIKTDTSESDGEGVAVENISLSYAKCEIIYNDSSNKTGNPQRSGYDLTTATPL